MRTTKTAKKLAAVLMLVSFIFGAAAPAMAAGLADITDIAGGNGGMAKGNASTIYFGNYWQSYKGSGATDAKESYNYEGIKWRVLSNGSGKTFLLSDQGLYADQFNSSSVTANKNVWGDDANGISSEIRTTLNNTTADSGFAGDAFNAKEYAAIADTTHTAGGSHDNSTVSSTDKIFLLSIEEAMNTDYGFANGTGATSTREMTATEMAKNVKMYGNSSAAYVNDGNSCWWLRSPGDTDNYASNVSTTGNVYDYDLVYNDNRAARAALNLNQESVLLLSAAVGGKGADACVGAFGLDNTYTGSNGWKLTLKDAYNETTNPTGIKAPTNVSVTQRNTDLDDVAAAAGAGGTMDLTSGHYTSSWSNPVIAYDAQAITEGKANYVSAIAKDGSGNLVNYAKISGNMSETNKAIDINSAASTLADGEYTMYVYAEQANGDKETDYASELSEGYAIHKGTTTKNEGVLTAAYADKGLTASLGNNFKLGFESAKYDTKVTVGSGSGEVFGGTTIAELNANENTTVTGFVNAETATIASGKQITTNGAFVSDNYVAIGKGAVVNSTATNSVALGSGSVADEANTISVGAAGTERKIVNVASGGPLTANGTNAANIGDIFGETRVDADKNYVKAANTAAENLVALDTAIGAKQSGTYIAEANSVNTNLKALDTQVKTNTDAITALTGGSAEFKANTVEITTSGEVASGDKKAVSGGTLYNELRPADGDYVKAANTTAQNLKALEAAFKPVNNVVASKNLDDAAAAQATAAGATAVGWGNVAGGERSTAVGYGNEVTGARSGAFGDPNNVTGSGSYAIGNDNTIANNNTFVLGSGVTTTQDNSVILGSGSTDRAAEGGAAGVVSVGSEAELRQLINLAAGTQDTDAVNVKQLNDAIEKGISTRGVTYTDNNKNLIRLGSETTGAPAKISNLAAGEVSPTSTDAVNGAQLYQTNLAISANSQEIKEVGAISAALAGLHYAEPTGEEGDKFSAAAAYGGYRGESAAAVGVAFKPTPNFMLSASTSVGNTQNAYNAGISFKFGKGETAVTRAALQKQVQFVSDKNTALEEKNNSLAAENAAQNTHIAKLESDKLVQNERLDAQSKLIQILLDRVEKLENNKAKPAPVSVQKQPKAGQPKVKQPKAEQPKPETKTAAVQKPVSGKNIQVLSSARRSDSQRLADSLNAKGYNAFVGEGVVKGRTYYRTFVDGGDNPQAVLRQLKAAGINGFIFK